MARRIAQKHGLAPSSDFDAVRLLRHRGVDPFARGGKLELVVDMGRNRRGAAAQAPAGAIPPTACPPWSPATQPRHDAARGAETRRAPQPISADDRAAEIMKVQRDIARRRRKRLSCWPRG
jgi:capsular polysaccharide transport system permease protein